MVKVVITPAAGVGVAFGVLYSDVGPVELAGKVTTSGRLGARAVSVLFRQRQLQFLQKDRAFREHAGLLIDVVRSRLDINVVKFREIRLAAIKRVRSQRRSDEDPFIEVFRQQQFALVVVLGQVPLRRRRGVLRGRLMEENSAARKQSERGGAGEQFFHDVVP